MTPIFPAGSRCQRAMASVSVETTASPASAAAPRPTAHCQSTSRSTSRDSVARRLYGPPPRSPLNPCAHDTSTSVGVLPTGNTTRPDTGSTDSWIGRCTVPPVPDG